ncbi:MAG: YceI family protein [Nibricoccus sp.]
MKNLLFSTALFVLASLPSFAVPLTIDKDRSKIEVAVKATMDSFTASLPAYDAAIAVDPAAKRVESAQVKFRFTDVKTGKDKRDVEMNHWQETEKFPDCLYVMDSLKPVGGDLYNANGKFTLHGVTKEISFPVTILIQTDGTCKLDSEFPLDTQDYGLPIFKKFGMLKVNPLLKIKFHLEGRVAGGA